MSAPKDFSFQNAAQIIHSKKISHGRKVNCYKPSAFKKAIAYDVLFIQVVNSSIASVSWLNRDHSCDSSFAGGH